MVKSCSNHELVRLLSICGQVEEHKREKMRDNGVGEAQTLGALAEREQQLLRDLLTKLQKQWLQDHAQHHRKP